VLAAVEAFRARDLVRFGQLMCEAHVSLRDDFEASCREIDTLVELANQQPGCYGARLTGGGFGGCTVNLVAAAHADAFTRAMREGYKKATNIDADIYTTRASAGAHQVTLGQ
jgi:galactokinase